MWKNASGEEFLDWHSRRVSLCLLLLSVSFTLLLAAFATLGTFAGFIASFTRLGSVVVVTALGAFGIFSSRLLLLFLFFLLLCRRRWVRVASLSNYALFWHHLVDGHFFNLILDCLCNL